MAIARSRFTRETQIAFDALSIEGGLLTAEWLARVAQLEAGSQADADYRIPKGLHVREEIGRYWRIAQAHWADLESGRAQGGEAMSGANVSPIGRNDKYMALAACFVEGLLRDAFGFASIRLVESVPAGERQYPIRFLAAGDRVPIVVAPAGTGLDTALAELGDGRRRRSAFALLQEFLNASSTAIWGIACDGHVLRLARDNASLTRPAWVEADLRRIFTEGLYPDFAALWLLVHESRFGRAGDPPDASVLESWREAGQKEGTLAREKLRRGFEEALRILGQGFLSHPENISLQAALQAGALSKEAYFGQLLRLVYRFIFVLALEERRLLHAPDAPSSVAGARELYAAGYALGRLRDRAIRRSAHDRYGDHWETAKIIFRGLAAGEPRLGLPALAGLFTREQCPDLDRSALENRALLAALFHLSWLREESGLVRVNWRDMGPDELGYIYEGLLELVPKITEDGRTFTFAEAGESRGHARKTTGSYYTPDELVQLLIKSALEPVALRTVEAHPDRPAEALLDLAIVDPACGSGHFLLAAARRLAEYVSRARTQGAPAAADYRHALRDVVRRCIYGVDMNPLAVELCTVSLWMEAVDPGQPLTFLKSHIRHGNSLIGTNRRLMGDAVPDAAWTAIEGDEKELAALLRKRNKEEIIGYRRLPFEGENGSVEVRQAVADLEAAPDADVPSLEEKERRWRELLASKAYDHEKLVADAWCAAFFWPKEEYGPVTEAAPTTGVWRALRDREAVPSPVLVETTRRIAEEYAFFHWELAFPHVFARGGFDVVLGNPPWEHLELKEQEFFAKREPLIANAPKAAARKALIQGLQTTNSSLSEEWQAAKRNTQGETHFARSSGRFPLCARGRINTYALFAEHNWSILCQRGRAGFIVPSGIATDDITKDYFQAITHTGALHSMWEFENKRRYFPDAEGGNVKFALVTLSARDLARATDFFFQGQALSELDDPERHFSLSAHQIALINPNSGTCAIFRTKRDASITLAVYSRAGVLWREGDPHGNPWGLRFLQGLFNMASDSGLFRTRGELGSAGWTLEGNRFIKDGKVMLPLYEAKMINLYNHRSGTYEAAAPGERQHRLPSPTDEELANPCYVPIPFYWVAQEEVDSRLDGVWDQRWLVGWRDVTDARTVARTLVAAVIPRVGVGHQMPLALASTEARLIAALYANLGSLSLDYVARQKVGGLHLTYFILKQLPLFTPAVFARTCPWSPDQTILEWVLPRVIELTYTAWDVKPFAEDCGDDDPPFLWDRERRFRLQCEIDAAFFHLYGLPRDDVDYVLSTFDVLRRAEERAYREFRTRRVVLETFDALARAKASGAPYVSPLGPPRRTQ